MNSFPTFLKPANKSHFKRYREHFLLGLLRQEITDNVLCGDENNYYALDIFQNAHKLTDKQINRLTKRITGELTALGWNIKTSFGNTGLFIYSTEEPPPSCFNGEF